MTTNSNDLELKKLVDRIPGDDYEGGDASEGDEDDEDGGEWWKDDARDRYLAAAKRLSKLGMKNDEIEDFLSDLYWAAASCFGA